MPLMRYRSPLASLFSQTPVNTARPWIRASVSRDVPVYTPASPGTYSSLPTAQAE